MNDDIRALATVLAPDPEPGDKVYVRRGVITAISGRTATVTISGTSIANIPAYQDISLSVGANVDVLFDNGAPVIIGALTASPWTAVTFQNSWANYGGGYYDVAYMQDGDGMVHFRGLAASGTMGAAIFTLPSALRPSRHLNVLAASNNTWTIITIFSTGPVIPSTVSGSNGWVSLDNISFQPS